MGGTIKAPLSQETKDLFKSNSQFFESISKVMGESGLNLILADAEAQTETKVLSDGNVEVTFTYPIDDKGTDATDGRLYMRDKFVWDAKEKQVQNFKRDFTYNGEGDRERWKPLLAKWQAATAPTPDAVTAFALAAGRSWSRPITKSLTDILKPKAASDFFKPVVDVLQAEQLDLRISPKTTHYTVVYHQGANATNEVIFSYEVDDKDENTTGKIRMRDSFIVSQSGEVLGYDRKWDVDVGSTPKEIWKARAAALSGKAKPSLEEAKKFLTGFIPAVYDEHPQPSAEKEPDAPSAPPPGGYAEMTPALFNTVMDKMVERDKALTGDKLEAGALGILKAAQNYFVPLAQTAKELTVNLADPRIRFSMGKDKDNKQIVTMEMPLSEGKWAEETDGVLKYRERFTLENGKVTGLVRTFKVEGPDPKGRLAAVADRLKNAEAQGVLPNLKTEAPQELLGYLMPYLNSDLAYTGKTKVIDKKDLDADRRTVMSALGKIHESLKEPLGLVTYDAKKASQIFRLLNALEYDDQDTAAMTIQEAQADVEKTLQSYSDIFDLQKKNLPLSEDQQKRLQDPELIRAQDFSAMIGVINSVNSRNYEDARALLSQVKSPILKKSMQGPVDHIWKQKHTAENLDFIRVFAADDLHQRYLSSTKMTSSGPAIDEKAEGEVINKLYVKAVKLSAEKDIVGSLNVLTELSKASDLTDVEKNILGRLTSHDLVKKLGDIEKEPSVDMQAKSYFELARGDLFEKGFVGVSQYIAQRVVISKMPKSRSLESIDLLEEAAKNSRQMSSDKVVAAAGDKAVQDAIALLQKDQEGTQFEKTYETAVKTVKESPEIKKAFETSDAFDGLFEKWIGAIVAKPDEPILPLLQGLTDLSDQQKALAEVLLKEPGIAQFANAGTIKNREQRIAEFRKIFEAGGEDGKKQADQYLAQLESPKIKGNAGLETVFLIANLAQGPVKQQTNQMYLAAVITQIQKDAVAKAQQENGPKLDSLASLMEKARVKAVGNPNESMFGIINKLEDKDLDDGEKALRKQLLEDKALAGLDKLTAEPNAEEREKKYKSYVQGISQKTQLVNLAKQLGDLPDDAQRGKLINFLKEDKKPEELAGADGMQLKVLMELKKSIDKTQLPKLEAIANEKDPEKRLKLVDDLRNSPEMSETGMVNFAAFLQYSVTSRKIPDPMANSKDEFVKAQVASFGKEVNEFIGVTEGKGNFGAKFGYGLPHQVKELTKPTMVLAMTGAGLLGPLAEMRVLQGLGKAGTVTWKGELFAAGVGVGTESFVFTGLNRGLNKAFVAAPDPKTSFMGEWGSNALMFGSMRTAHYAGTQFAERVLASGKPGLKWAGGRVVGPQTTHTFTDPAGKIYPGGGTQLGVPQLTVAGKFTAGVANHGLAILAMTGSGYGSRYLGWQPQNGQGFSGNLVDAMMSYTHAMIGFSVANRITGNKLQTGIAAIKLRSKLATMDPAKVENWDKDAIAAAREAGLPELLREKLLKDLQLSDLKGGKEGGDVTLEPGQEVFLDQMLLGTDTKTIKLVKKADGQLAIIDARQPELDADGAPKPFDVIKIGDKVVQGGVETPLGEGQTIHVGEKSLGVSLPSASKMVELFAKLDPEFQMTLLRKMAAAKDFESLIKQLKDDYREGAALAYEVINAILEGKILLHMLPTEMNFQSRVRELMQVEIDSIAKEQRLDDFKLNPEFTNPNWSEVEANFHRARKVKFLMDGIKMAQDIGMLAGYLKESHLETVDGVKAEQIQEFLNLQHTKSRLNDIKLQLAAVKKSLEELEGNKGLKAEAKEKSKQELELLQKQLEKSQEVYEAHVTAREAAIQSEGDIGHALGLRQKALDFLAQETTPIETRLDKKEQKVLLNLVQKYLQMHIPDDLGTAEQLLFYHFDSASPQAKELLLKATPEAKAVLFKVYFGSSPRIVSDATAAQLVIWMAQADVQGVAKVTYRQIGNRFVPHLEMSDAAYQGKADGLNLIHARGKKAEPTELLFSAEEVKEVVNEAKEFVAGGHGDNMPPNALYDAAGKTYRNWVVHPEGGSVARVEFDDAGAPKKIVIQYSAKDGAILLSSKFTKAKEAIETAAKELGLPVELQAMDMKKFHETLPGKVADLSRLDAFSKDLHSRKIWQILENRGLNKKFEPTNQDIGPKRKASGMPEWLKEFIEENFDGENLKQKQKADDEITPEQQDKALEFYGLTLDELLKDPASVQKKFKAFQIKYHPDKAGRNDAEAKALTQKFKDVGNYKDTLEKLVDQAKTRSKTKGKEDAEADKSEEVDASMKSGLEIFADGAKEKSGPIKVVGFILNGLIKFWENVIYGQSGKPLSVRKAEAAARKAKAEAKAAKQPPQPPAAPVAGPKIDGPREALPDGTVIPGTRIVSGERVNGVSPSYTEKTTPWMGEVSGKTDAGQGYGAKPGQTEAISEDGFAVTHNQHGDRTIIVSDGMGGHAGGKDATQIILDHATKLVGDGKELGEALLEASKECYEQNAKKGQGKAGATVAAAQIIRPSKKGEPYSVKFASAGDASGWLFRKGKDGRYYLVFQTVPENKAREIEDFAKKQAAEGKPLDPAAIEGMTRREGHVVNNALGRPESKIQPTEGGEVIDPANPKQMKPATDLKSIALEKDDAIVMMSDGANENVSPQQVVTWLNEGHSAEKIADMINAEGHRRMEILVKARDANATKDNRYEFKVGDKTFYMEVQGNHGYVYDAPKDGNKVDSYKTDHITAVVQVHNPGKAAKRGKPGPSGLKGGGGDKQLPAPEKTDAADPKDNTPAPVTPPEPAPPVNKPAADRPPVDPKDQTKQPDPVPTAKVEAPKAPEAEPLAIRYPVPDLNAFVERFGHNLSDDGFIFRIGKMPPVGTQVDLNVLLSSNVKLFEGKGTVVEHLAPSAADPKSKPGFKVRFDDLTPETAQFFDAAKKLKAEKEHAKSGGDTGNGNGSSGTPTPADNSGTGSPAAPAVQSAANQPKGEAIKADGDPQPTVKTAIPLGPISDPATDPMIPPIQAGPISDPATDKNDPPTIPGLRVAIPLGPIADPVTDLSNPPVDSVQAIEPPAPPPAKKGPPPLPQKPAKKGPPPLPVQPAKQVPPPLPPPARGTTPPDGAPPIVPPHRPPIRKVSQPGQAVGPLPPPNPPPQRKSTPGPLPRVTPPPRRVTDATAAVVQAPEPLSFVMRKVDNVDQFARHYPGGVTRGHMTLPTEKDIPVGTTIDLQFKNSTGKVLLTVKAEVRNKLAKDPKNPDQKWGLMLRIVEASPEDRALIDRIAAFQAATRKPVSAESTPVDPDEEITAVRQIPKEILDQASKPDNQ